MSDDRDFPDIFKEFSKLMFSPFDGLNEENLFHMPTPEYHQSTPEMSLRDQLIIQQPPSSSSEGESVYDKNKSTADHDDPIHDKTPNSDDHFNKDERTPMFPEFPVFKKDGLNSMMDDFFGRQFSSPFINRNRHLQDDERKDTDIDEDVRGQGLDAVLQNEQDSSNNRDDLVSPFAWRMPQSHNNHQSHFHGFHQTKSIIRRSDGSSEERIVKRGSDGREEITTIIQHPDGSREVTTQHNQTEADASPNNLYIEERSSSSRDTAPIFGLFSALRDIFTTR